jgi:hypothetical protein
MTKRSKAMEGDKKKQGYGGRQKEARLWGETKRSKTMEGGLASFCLPT